MTHLSQWHWNSFCFTIWGHMCHIPYILAHTLFLLFRSGWEIRPDITLGLAFAGWIATSHWLTGCPTCHILHANVPYFVIKICQVWHLTYSHEIFGMPEKFIILLNFVNLLSFVNMWLCKSVIGETMTWWICDFEILSFVERGNVTPWCVNLLLWSNEIAA